MAKTKERGPEECPHLAWVRDGSVMVCRACGAVRLPKPWEIPRSDTADVDALRIRHDGLDGDV